MTIYERQAYKMSDERWNSGTPENEFTGSG